MLGWIFHPCLTFERIVKPYSRPRQNQIHWRAYKGAHMLKRFLQDSSGASASEYGLILAIVGVALGGAAMALGGNVSFAVHDSADEIYDLNTAPDP